MPISDTVLFDPSLVEDKSNREDLDLLLETKGPVQGDSYGAILAAQATVLKNTETPIEDFKLSLLEQDKEALLNGEFSKRLSEKLDDIGIFMRGIIELDPSGTKENLQAGAELFSSVTVRKNDPIGIEKQVVEDLSNLTFGEAIEREEAGKLAMYNDIANLLDKQGFWDQAINYGGLLFPFNFVKDTSDVSDIAREHGVNFSNANSLSGFIIDFNSLPLARRQLYWPKLKEAVLEATESNEIKTASILLSFLDPQGAQNIKEERLIDMAVSLTSVFDVALIASVFRKMAINIAKRNGIVTAMKNTDNLEDAAELTTGAVVDKDIANATTMTPLEGYNNAMPFFRDSNIDPAYLEGLSTASQKRLAALRAESKEFIIDFSQERRLLREGLLTREEKIKHIKKEMDKFNADPEDFNSLEGDYVENLRFTEPTEEGFTITYDMRAPDGDLIGVEERTTWNINQVTGDFEETVHNINTINTRFGSPTLWSAGENSTDFKASVDAASRIDELQAGFRKEISDLMQKATKPLKGVQNTLARRRVDAVLVAGDEVRDTSTAIRGTTYSPIELQAGINTRIGTVKLTSPKEQEAYYGMRQMADTMWSFENHATRRRLVIQGQKEVTLNNAPIIARPFSKLQDADRSISANQTKRIFNQTDTTVVDYTPELLEKEYGKGNILVRTFDRDGYKTPNFAEGTKGNEIVDYALVKLEDIAELPEQVIHYKPGYVAKINKGVEFLVKETIRIGTRGTESVNSQKTLRFFSNKNDAETYAQLQRDRAIAELEVPTEAQVEGINKRFNAIPDRELTPEQRLGEARGPSAGLYTGARSSDDILSGLSGSPTERIGAFEAFDRNAGHLSSLMSRNEWRIGQEQRWLNTVKEVLGNEFSGKSFRETTLPADKLGRALEIEREQINRWNNIPTNEEGYFRGAVQNLHDWSLYGTRKVPGFQNKDSIKSILYLKHSDPFAAAKAAAFHTLLGVFNPVQLFVQGQAATVALARFKNVADAPRAVKHAFTMGILDNIQDAGALRKQYALIKKDPDLDLKEIQELHSAWLSTGMKDSIRTNADIQAADSGVIGVSSSSLRRATEKGLVFYRIGELFNRRTSFSMAYLNWKRVNPGKAVNNQAIKEMLTDSKLSMLELSKANKARWQGGPDRDFLDNTLGMMTQFGQVMAKTTQLAFLQTAKTGGFAGAEKAKILAAQFALYGAAGVPLGNAILPSILDWVGVDGKELDPSIANAWNQGIMGVIAKDGFGANIDVSNRAAVIGNVVQFYKELLFSDSEFSAQVLGAFGTVANRGMNAFGVLAPLATSGIKGREMTKADMLIAFSELSKLSSTGNSFWKSHMMHNLHRIVDYRNNAILIKDFNFATEVGAALGFKPTDESRVRQLQQDNKTVSDRVNARAEDIVRVYHNYLILGEGNTRPDTVANMMTFMFEAIGDPIEEAMTKAAVERKIFTETKTVEQRELKKWFERNGPFEVLDGLSSMERLGRTQALSQPIGQQGVKQSGE